MTVDGLEVVQMGSVSLGPKENYYTPSLTNNEDAMSQIENPETMDPVW